jgi:hypothetical protein
MHRCKEEYGYRGGGVGIGGYRNLLLEERYRVVSSEISLLRVVT